MSRVVPSQIVVLIDRILSGMPASAGPHARNLSTSQAPEISAVIDLISELPDEFLVLSGDEYSHYRVDINTLRDLLSLWKSSQPVGIINEKTIQSLNRRTGYSVSSPNALMKHRRHQRPHLHLFTMLIFAIASGMILVPQIERCMMVYGRPQQCSRAVQRKHFCSGLLRRRSQPRTSRMRV